jgi:probable O-glycosylation ligase (exosortase A-associated)
MSTDQGHKPFLAAPSTQIAAAVIGCAVIGTVWLGLAEPLGKTGILLLLLPLLGALLPITNMPFALVLAFVVLSYFRLPEIFPALYPLRLPQLVAVAALASLGWHLLATRRVRPFWSPELTLFTLFFVLVTLSVLFATNRQTAMGYWSAYYVKIAVVVPAVAWLATSPRHHALASRLFVIAGVVVGAVALWNKLHGIDLVEGSRVTIGRELDSVLGDPNDLALVLLFPTSFALGLGLTRGSPATDRLLGLCGFAMLTLAILATQSRGGLLGLATVIGVFVRQYTRSKAVLGAAVILGAVALLALANVEQRLQLAAVEDGGIDESSQVRLWAWGAALAMALDHPLTGVGIGTFEDNYFFYTPHWTGKAYVAHSTWFEVLAEIGFPGLFVYVALIALAAGRLLRVSRRLDKVESPPAARAMASSLLAGMAGFVAGGTFLSQAFTWPIYVILALSIAVCRWSAQSAILAKRGS